MCLVCLLCLAVRSPPQEVVNALARPFTRHWGVAGLQRKAAAARRGDAAGAREQLAASGLAAGRSQAEQEQRHQQAGVVAGAAETAGKGEAGANGVAAEGVHASEVGAQLSCVPRCLPRFASMPISRSPYVRLVAKPTTRPSECRPCLSCWIKQ